MTRKDQWKSSPEGNIRVADGPAAARPPAVGDAHADEVARRIETYAPRDLPAKLWEETLRPFVIPALRASKPVGVPAMERFARVLTLISAWCVKQGIPLGVETVLDPDTVERFSSSALRGLLSRPTYRSCLRMLGRKLTKTAPWTPRPQPMAERKAAPPYSSIEIAALREDAERQATPERRRGHMAIILLGAGAGLDGRWVRKVRGTEVFRRAGAVLVKVGEPRPRLIPVLAAYEEDLLALAAEAGEDYLVGGTSAHKNTVSDLTGKFEPGHRRPKLEPKRLRSTWIVHHLSAGTRLPELLEAAGTSRIETFDILLKFIPPLPAAAARVLLRGDR